MELEEGVEKEGQSPDESLMTKHITKRSVNKVEREERGFFVDVRSRRIHTRLARRSHVSSMSNLSFKQFFPAPTDSLPLPSAENLPPPEFRSDFAERSVVPSLSAHN